MRPVARSVIVLVAAGPEAVCREREPNTSGKSNTMQAGSRIKSHIARTDDVDAAGVLERKLAVPNRELEEVLPALEPEDTDDAGEAVVDPLQERRLEHDVRIPIGIDARAQTTVEQPDVCRHARGVDEQVESVCLAAVAPNRPGEPRRAREDLDTEEAVDDEIQRRTLVVEQPGSSRDYRRKLCFRGSCRVSGAPFT